jgi:Domain of unknown function (DUF4150)
MADVQALDMDIVTEKSGHSVVGMAVSVCLTPAAPAPLPMPYPLTASVSEGIADSPLRTKVAGSNCATIGSVLKTCHGNEPGTLKEVVSLNTSGPVAPITGAFTVLIELGPAAITGSICDMNKAPTPGAGASASDAGGSGGGGGGGAGGPGAGGGPGGPSGPGGGGGGGGGGGAGASASPATAAKGKYCPPPGTKAPPGMAAGIAANDLRNPANSTPSAMNQQGQMAMKAATQGAPGGSGQTVNPDGSTSRGQAFWSGSGKDVARDQGQSIQENSGGAAKLEKMGNQGTAPTWGSDANAGAGSGVTGEKLWKTISQRSAENASGSVDAYVVGEARKDNVFASTELPTMLHNPNLQQIRFRDPTNPGGAPVTWKKDGAGCWNGPDVPAGTSPPHAHVNPGFKLDPAKGFTR